MAPGSLMAPDELARGHRETSVHGSPPLENPHDNNNGHDDEKEMDKPTTNWKDESPHQPAQEEYYNDRFEHDTPPLLMLRVASRLTPAPHHLWK